MSLLQIIQDPDKLTQFIEWLPGLEAHETYYLCLQARKKYKPELQSTDKTQLRRFTANKATMWDKIRQLECPVGSYRTKVGTEITEEAIALYITINPRDMVAGSYMTIQKLAADLRNHSRGQDTPINPQAVALTQIHKAKSRSNFVVFDVDFPEGSETDENAPKTTMSPEELLQLACEIVGTEAVTTLRTRGGVHVLVQPKLVVSRVKNWFPEMCRALNTDQSGDLMIPVPGCIQGGFIPYFYPS